eukprot:1157407-Pelagomonas_calceolata.AAC.7
MACTAGERFLTSRVMQGPPIFGCLLLLLRCELGLGLEGLLGFGLSAFGRGAPSARCATGSWRRPGRAQQLPKILLFTP